MSEQSSNQQVPAAPVPPPGYPEQRYPQQPGYSQQQGYSRQPGYPQQYMQPVKPRAPALAKRQRRGAMIAGGVGFILVQIGLLCFSLLTTLAIFALFAGFIVSVSRGRDEGFNQFFSEFIFNGLSQIDPVVIGVVVAVVIAVGVLTVLFGILASRWILKSHGVNRPTAVTWSALGIAIVSSWIMGGFSWFGSRFIGTFDNHFTDTIMPWIIGVLGVLSILTSVAIGVFAWWWMAHVFRSRAAVDQAAVGQAAVGPAGQ